MKRMIATTAVFLLAFGASTIWAKPKATVPAGPVDEFSRLQADLKARPQDAKGKADFEKILSEAASKESLLSPSDRDPADVVLRRTKALLNHLAPLPGAGDLSTQTRELQKLADENARIAVDDAGARKALFDQAVKLRRQIAFGNPLLTGLDKLLFITRDPAKYEHMCDQYYGFNAHPRGGLFVLENPFSDHPSVRNVLADAVCTNGRFQGRKLENGGFLSPELSFDGRQILFAFTETKAPKGPAAQWVPETTYHIFKVNADGTNLTQLTDGAWNDFDPCWLPNGRIAFISERRGGYLRCSGARPCPNYTLHTMNDDGSDIVCISPHESHEWQPSVDHNGMILYTRWDYIDRGANEAHHPWITTPDGRDPRALHGNYPVSFKERPHMEMDVRAIPESRKLVATAAPHHGQAYGSLVLVDTAVPDDDKMSQVRRITPYARFNEAEVGATAQWYYATPWPLSEEFYLCVYSPTAHTASNPGRHDIYLVDVFGNQELVYSAGDISCLSPMPLRPRPTPPIVPNVSTVGLAKGTTPAPAAASQPASDANMAKIAIMNVYESHLPWPEGVKIKSLRVVHTVIKSTPVHHRPQIGYGCETGARAVWGTVPVEDDGSAYFYIPAGKTVLFQALDANGLAVQSMRSETWAQPGETLLCNGCHDRREQRPAPKDLPLALRRAPSNIAPDVDGSNPFNFPRLVQPVLEKNCVECHLKNANKEGTRPPDLRKGDFMKDEFRWYASYRNLMPYAYHHGKEKYGLGDYDLWTLPRTTPGQFGARASKLYTMLAAGHHKINLTSDEMHRIALWLDSNSDFFGAYENLEAQSRGEIVYPKLE